MRTVAIGAGLATAALLASAAGITSVAAVELSEQLRGGNENPPVVSDGTGRFRGVVREGRIRYRLVYNNLVDVTQAHIHVANPGNNGGIAAFLCSNIATPGVPECPLAGPFTGEIRAEDVLAVTDGQTTVLEAEDLQGLIRLIRQGATYVNVHTEEHLPGEIRGQINPRPR